MTWEAKILRDSWVCGGWGGVAFESSARSQHGMIIGEGNANPEGHGQAGSAMVRKLGNDGKLGKLGIRLATIAFRSKPSAARASMINPCTIPTRAEKALTTLPKVKQKLGVQTRGM